MSPLTAIAQLRHLYALMLGRNIVHQDEAARGLLAPAIEALEKVHTPGAQPCILECDSPSLPPTAAEMRECGCAGCLDHLVLLASPSTREGARRLPAAPVEVKPLVWTHLPSRSLSAIDHEFTTWHAKCGIVRWTIKGLAHGAYALYSPIAEDVGAQRFRSLAAAQAAAQDQWTTFIRSALQP